MQLPKFPLGTVTSSAGVIAKVDREDALKSLKKHEAADWEEDTPEDRRENEAALRCDLRIWTVHRDRNKVLFWIITDADRSTTKLMLPAEHRP